VYVGAEPEIPGLKGLSGVKYWTYQNVLRHPPTGVCVCARVCVCDRESVCVAMCVCERECVWLCVCAMKCLRWRACVPRMPACERVGCVASLLFCVCVPECVCLCVSG